MVLSDALSPEAGHTEPGKECLALCCYLFLSNNCYRQPLFLISHTIATLVKEIRWGNANPPQSGHRFHFIPAIDN
jgi:hypothetical protein